MTSLSVEIFTAGCPLCDDAVQRVQRLAGSGHRVDVLDMNDESTQTKATRYGVTRVPAVAVNGTLADCCARGGIDVDSLRQRGVGGQE
jgi:predicted DCC family thiol-disulfide oxidoreductase YuxK